MARMVAPIEVPPDLPPAIPIAPADFSAIAEAARQQTDLLFWVARQVQEHSDQIAQLVDKTNSIEQTGGAGSARWSSFQQKDPDSPKSKGPIGRLSGIVSNLKDLVTAKMAEAESKAEFSRSASQASARSEREASPQASVEASERSGSVSSTKPRGEGREEEEKEEEEEDDNNNSKSSSKDSKDSQESKESKESEEEEEEEQQANKDDQEQEAVPAISAPRELPRPSSSAKELEPPAIRRSKSKVGDPDLATCQAMALAAENAAVKAQKTAEATAEATELALSDISDETDKKLEGFANFINTELDQNGKKLEANLRGKTEEIASNLIQKVLPGVREELEAMLNDRLDKRFSAGLSSALDRALIPSPAPAPAAAVRSEEEASKGSKEKRASRSSSRSSKDKGDSKEGAAGAAAEAATTSAAQPAPQPVAAASPLNEEMLAAVRMMHADVKQRLPALEDGLQEIKSIRLQIPNFQNEIEALRESVKALKEANSRPVSEGGNPFDSLEPAATSPTGSYGGIRKLSLQRRSTEMSSFYSRSSSPHGGEARASEAPVPEEPPTSAPAPVPEEPKIGVPKDVHLMMEDLNIAFRNLDKKVSNEALSKVRDMDQLLRILEDRVQTLDDDYRAHSSKTSNRLDHLLAKIDSDKEEQRRVSKTWNLAHQVDVIQSLVGQEMRHARSAFEASMERRLSNMGPNEGLPGAGGEKGPNAGGGSAGAGKTGASAAGTQAKRPDSPLDDVIILKGQMNDMLDKVKRLQENFQQCTLKIAGLKTYTRNLEVQGESEADKLKRLVSEVENLSELATKNEVRLDYLSLHGSGTTGGGLLSSNVGNSTTFNEAVGWSAGEGASPQAGGPRASPKRGFGGPEKPAMLTPGGSAGAAAVPASPTSPAAIASRGRGGRRSSMGPMSHHQAPEPLGLEAGGAPSPPNEGGEAGSLGGIGMGNLEVKMNTQRIVRLGKKMTDFDKEMRDELKRYSEELQTASMQLAQIIAFLPRRQRKVVQRICEGYIDEANQNGKDEKDEEEEAAEEKEKKKHRLRFNDVVETRKFQVQEDVLMPWQLVGEPDQKWNWCYSSVNEMGRELARHLEQQEHEYQEFEKDISKSIERLEEELRSRPAGSNMDGLFAALSAKVPHTRQPSRRMADSEGDDGAADGASAEKLRKQLEKTILPQILSLEERVERLLNEAKETKKQQESQIAKKLDKDELQVVLLRIEKFDKFDPKQLLARVEGFDQSAKHMESLVDSVSEQMRNLEGQLAHRNELTKVRQDCSAQKAEVASLQQEVKGISEATYRSNRHNTTALADLKAALDKQVQKLTEEKLHVKEFADLQERVSKLDSGLRDNRQILGDANGLEINAIVKRIILNLEDKIMVLEKKMDAVIDAAANQGAPSDADLSPRSHPATTNAHTSPAPSVMGGSRQASHTVLPDTSQELDNITTSLNQLKQEIAIHKLDMERLSFQTHQNAALADKLNVLVEAAGGAGGAAAGGGDGETGGTAALSLQRVQLMISAAARQLVAGSKWITKETFDTRLGEVRKEYLSKHHSTQMQLEELANLYTPNRSGSHGGSHGHNISTSTASGFGHHHHHAANLAMNLKLPGHGGGGGGGLVGSGGALSARHQTHQHAGVHLMNSTWGPSHKAPSGPGKAAGGEGDVEGHQNSTRHLLPRVTGNGKRRLSEDTSSRHLVDSSPSRSPERRGSDAGMAFAQGGHAGSRSARLSAPQVPGSSRPYTSA